MSEADKPKTDRFTSSYTSKQIKTASGTQQMQAMLSHTLESYPPHYQAALRLVQEGPDGGLGFACVGAMETELSDEGMTVAFDFRRKEPSWGRLIVEVTMSFGQVIGHSVRFLRQGEPCGIEALDSVG